MVTGAESQTSIYTCHEWQFGELCKGPCTHGAGGALSVQELLSVQGLLDVLRLSSDNLVLAPRAILHTDSAKAYRRLGPMQWLGRGRHHKSFTVCEPFRQHEWSHINVTHKRKIEKMQCTTIRSVVLPNGVVRHTLGGTQQVDGFWAYLRSMVGKVSVQTGLATDSDKRLHFSKLVRLAQWHYRHLHENRFAMCAPTFMSNARNSCLCRPCIGGDDGLFLRVRVAQRLESRTIGWGTWPMSQSICIAFGHAALVPSLLQVDVSAEKC